MSENTKEWVAVGLFASCFFLLTACEVVWLNRRGWAAYGKSTAFSIITNVVSFFVGSIVSFVILGVILAVSWEGSINQMRAGELTLWALLAAAILTTPLLLLLTKRLFLWLLRMNSGFSAWAFSFWASFTLFLFTVGLPIAFLYFV